MTINRRTLLRMPLDKVVCIACYWGVYVEAHPNMSLHTWKLLLIRKLWFNGYGTSDLKSDYSQWRYV